MCDRISSWIPPEFFIILIDLPVQSPYIAGEPKSTDCDPDPPRFGVETFEGQELLFRLPLASPSL
jgi:hypothetical protein